MNISYNFITYIIYSVIGWLSEVTLYLVKKKRFVNRGFLIGPYCPIYGKGAMLVIFLLNRYLSEPLTLFILSIAVCSFIEYSGSFILEKMFKTSWWDYSNKKFNINGRICLETMIPFGLGCLVLMYAINPFVTKLLYLVPNNTMNIIALIVFVIYVLDYVISLSIIIKFRNISQNAKSDSTEKVTEFVKKEILKRKQVLYTRLIESFPNFKIRKK